MRQRRNLTASGTPEEDLLQRLPNPWTIESAPAHRALRGIPRSGLWSEGEIASSGTGSERAQGRERSGGDPPGSPCAKWPSVPGDPDDGSVCQAIYETLHYRSFPPRRSSPLGHDPAGDAVPSGQVLLDAEEPQGPAGEPPHGFSLGLPDLQPEPPARLQVQPGIRHERTDHRQSVRTGHKRPRRLESPDFPGKRIPFLFGNVWGVRHHYIKTVPSFQGGISVRAKEPHPIRDHQGARVLPGDGQGARGDVHREEIRRGKLRRQRHRDRPAPRSDIENLPRPPALPTPRIHDSLDQPFRLGPRDERFARQTEFPPVELPRAKEVLDGLAGTPAPQEGTERAGQIPDFPFPFQGKTGPRNPRKVGYEDFRLGRGSKTQSLHLPAAEREEFEETHRGEPLQTACLSASARACPIRASANTSISPFSTWAS